MSLRRPLSLLVVALLSLLAAAPLAAADVKPRFRALYVARVHGLEVAHRGLVRNVNAVSGDVARTGAECLRLKASQDPNDREQLELLKQYGGIQAGSLSKTIPLLRRSTLKLPDALSDMAENWFDDEPGDHIVFNRGIVHVRESYRLGIAILQDLRDAYSKLSDADCAGARQLAQAANAKAKRANDRAESGLEALESLK